MAWQDEMVTILRTTIMDLATTPTYSDDRLQQVIVVCARYVLQEMTFSQPFTADVSNIDIRPDPTNDSGNTRDDSFINMVCLKAACFTDRGEARLSAGQAVSVKDGSSSIDLRSIASTRLAMLQKGWCKVYDDEKFAYMSGQVRTAGAAIMTPFRVFAGYNAVGAYYPVEDRGPNYAPF